MRLHPLAPVVALDIDGTLADYYNHFEWFANLYMQPKSEIKANWDFTEGDEFSEALNLDKNKYRDIKLAYRQGGMKRSLPVFAGAAQMIHNLRSDGIQVWICTTRPWQRLDNIDPDTQFWLNRTVGKVDGVIYGEDKYLDLIDIVGRDRILAVADDIPANIVSAESLGLTAFLAEGEHNAKFRRTRNPKSFRPGNTGYHQLELAVLQQLAIYKTRTSEKAENNA